jgi:hypothetical protein
MLDKGTVSGLKGTGSRIDVTFELEGKKTSGVIDVNYDKPGDEVLVWLKDKEGEKSLTRTGLIISLRKLTLDKITLDEKRLPKDSIAVFKILYPEKVVVK